MKDQILLAFISFAGLLLLFNPFMEVEPLGEQYMPTNPRFQEFVDQFEKHFKNELKWTGTPGAAMVIVQDTSVYLMNGYGRKVNKWKKKDPVDVNTVFRIGSLSKGFGSILTGTYVDDGILTFDDKVKEHIPEFSLMSDQQAQRVNIRHVLSHTTGISYHAYTDLIENKWKYKDIMAMFPKAKLATKEGEAYSYQNAIYSIVGEIMERKSEKQLSEIYQEKLFTPLGMDNASVTYDGIAKNDNHAIPHKLSKKSWKPVKLTSKYYNAVPAGGVNASISDMAGWCQALLGNRPDVVSDEVLDEVFTPHINAHNKRKYFSRWKNVLEHHYGLGWRVVKRKNDEWIYHGGFVNNFKGEILFNREDKVAICILANAPSNLSSRSVALFLDMYEENREGIMDYWYPDKEEEPKNPPSL